MEFKVFWQVFPQPVGTKPDPALHPKAKIKHIATREIILQKFEAGTMFGEFRYQLIPLLSVRN